MNLPQTTIIDREAIAEAVVRHGLGLVAIQALHLSLEDIFLHLVTEDPAHDE